MSQHDAIPAALWALGFGLIAIIAVLAFLSWDRRRAFKEIGDLAKAGIPVVVISEQALAAPPTAPITTKRTGATAGGGSGPATPKIKGPTGLSVGVTAPYNLESLEQGATVAWTVDGPAELSAKTGASTNLTAKDVGKVTLHASLTSSSGTPVTPPPDDVIVTVIAAPKANAGDSIPILGIGYGTVVIALAVASVTTALGLTDVINGQAVAGILGSLVTFSVMKATGGGTGSSSGSGTGSSSKNAQD